MANGIAFARNYTNIIDEVYQRAATSHVLNSGRRVVRSGRNAKEILIPKISVTGLGDYTRNEGYKTGAITYEFETKTFNYDRGIKLLADVMDVEEAGLLDECLQYMTASCVMRYQFMTASCIIPPKEVQESCILETAHAKEKGPRQAY